MVNKTAGNEIMDGGTVKGNHKKGIIKRKRFSYPHLSTGYPHTYPHYPLKTQDNQD